MSRAAKTPTGTTKKRRAGNEYWNMPCYAKWPWGQRGWLVNAASTQAAVAATNRGTASQQEAKERNTTPMPNVSKLSATAGGNCYSCGDRWNAREEIARFDWDDEDRSELMHYECAENLRLCFDILESHGGPVRFKFDPTAPRGQQYTYRETPWPVGEVSPHKGFRVVQGCCLCGREFKAEEGMARVQWPYGENHWTFVHLACAETHPLTAESPIVPIGTALARDTYDE